MISSPGWQVRARHGLALALALATLTALPVLGQTAEPSPVVTSGDPTADSDGAWSRESPSATGAACPPRTRSSDGRHATALPVPVRGARLGSGAVRARTSGDLGATAERKSHGAP